MKKHFLALMASAACSVAAGQSVLELGYTPRPKVATVEKIVTNVVEKVVTNVVERVVEKPAGKAAEKTKKPTGRPARITSKSTVYNRKEGIASFAGNVYVDDEQYQMHADRVFLFMEGTNEVRRIVALGNVAMTNEMRRAYAAKATYSKKNGLVVLYSGDGITAEVRDESKKQDQVVRGSRIRFWMGTEQVEVDDADLTGAAPGGGASSLKKVLGK